MGCAVSLSRAEMIGKRWGQSAPIPAVPTKGTVQVTQAGRIAWSPDPAPQAGRIIPIRSLDSHSGE